jgi:alcohol dehydrogenase (cytochrome c)
VDRRNSKRGVALHGDKVYMTGQDAVLVALDAETGELAWESEPSPTCKRATT